MGARKLASAALLPALIAPMRSASVVIASQAGREGGVFYHVIARGNQRQDIFRDEKDRATYLERLEHYRKRYDFKLYSYVLMSNHVHLLIETQKIPLSKIMQGMQFTYTQYYNRRHRTVGHLFQGRHKAILWA